MEGNARVARATAPHIASMQPDGIQHSCAALLGLSEGQEPSERPQRAVLEKRSGHSRPRRHLGSRRQLAQTHAASTKTTDACTRASVKTGLKSQIARVVRLSPSAPTTSATRPPVLLDAVNQQTRGRGRHQISALARSTHSIACATWPPWLPPDRWPATASRSRTAWARRRRHSMPSRAPSTRSRRARRVGRRTWASVRQSSSRVSSDRRRRD